MKETTTPIYIGIDVSKANLDIAIRPTGETWQVSNDLEGIDKLVEKVHQMSPMLIILEATGGYETAVATALAVAGLPVAVVNPRQARDFAKSLGRLAKTDRIDAAMLAHFGEAVRPEPHVLADKESIELKALLVRRRQLIEMIVAEKNRIWLCHPSIRPQLIEHVLWLENELANLDKDLRDRLQKSPIWCKKDDCCAPSPA